MITFRLLEHGDLPLLGQWFNEPHAQRWYGGRSTHEYVDSIEGRVPIAGYIVLRDDEPVGLFEWLCAGDFPDLRRLYGIDDPDAANCDVILAGKVAHRGLGSAILLQFLEDIVFADPRITSSIIDPDTDNSIAIRAYEKAGFRFLRAVAEDGEGKSVYLMELQRSELGKPLDESMVLRPARVEELAVAVDIDDDAIALDKEAGIPIELPDDHPFVLAEVTRWKKACELGRLLFATPAGGAPVGFVALDTVGDKPLLEQISVRRAWMRRGIGRMLIERALRWSVRAGELWLTTYDHLPWNRPMYERFGFVRVDEAACSAELRAILAAERAVLPAPERRIAMRYRHSG